MLQKESRARVIDNSGGKEVLIFGTRGKGGRGACHEFRVGDIVKVTIKSAIPHSKVKKGDKYFALIARTKYPCKSRSNGEYVRFNENAVILLNASYNMIGSSVFGDIPKEIGKSNHEVIKKIFSVITGSVI